MLSFNIWLTTDCNFRCGYCYEGTNKSAIYMEKDIAEKVITFILNRVAEFRKDEITVNFHGGEPFLNFGMMRYIIEMLNEKAKLNGIQEIFYSVTTNGYDVKIDDIEYLVSRGVSISISLDGDKATHDRYRKTCSGNGTYEIIIKNALKILKIDPYIRCRMTYNSRTVKDLNHNIKHLAQLGFKEIVPVPDFFDANWDENSMEEIYLQLIQTKKDLKEKITNKEVSVYMIDNTPPTRKAICDGGVTNFHIYPNGNIYPCSYTVGYKDYCVGDINKGIDVKKIKKLEEINKKDIRECHGCNYKSYCTANRCKLVNKAITGEFSTPSLAICNFEGIALRLFQDNS